MADDDTTQEPTRQQAFKDLSEDTLGFGQVDLRTIRDLILRPRQVLEAWMTLGPTANGQYTRPLKLYLALNAILMLVLFLRGGSSYMLEGLQPEILNPILEASGKTRDGFLANADGWMSLTMVPILSLLYALATAPLLRWWDPEKLGWQKGFRSAYAYLNVWTVPLLPLSWFMYGTDPVAQALSVVMFVLGFVAFLRTGKGRWYQSLPGGIGKGLVLLAAIGVAGMIGFTIVINIGILAGMVS